jgi:hypothetical protein
VQQVTYAETERTESKTQGSESELDLVIGELEQVLPERASSVASTCISVYCSF